MKCVAICLVVLGVVLPATAELEAGKLPPAITLQGKDGGRLDGTPWSTAELTNKVHALFYVDPDVKDLNQHVVEAIEKQKFASESFQSIVVINLAATWKPNWIISAILRRTQKKYPRAVYIRDYTKVLVKQWGVADQNYDIILLDPAGRILKSYDGKLTDAQTTELVDTITSGIGAMPGEAETKE